MLKNIIRWRRIIDWILYTRPFGACFDKILVKISWSWNFSTYWNLESIGSTSDEYSAMSLAESCIPEDGFRVWFRSAVCNTNWVPSENFCRERLRNLLFLRAEIKREERTPLAESWFTNQQSGGQTEKIPSPADLNIFIFRITREEMD